MRELLFFYLEGCPYCRAAERYIEELCAREPRFRDVCIRRIEERRERKLADSYDYWLVPSFWLGDEKLHEGEITPERMREILSLAI